eukprot:1884842-Rhodomonas_salina.1
MFSFLSILGNLVKVQLRPIPLPMCYAFSGTDYLFAMCPPYLFAMRSLDLLFVPPGTNAGYAATHSSGSTTSLTRSTRSQLPTRTNFAYGARVSCLCAGTDCVYGTTTGSLVAILDGRSCKEEVIAYRATRGLIHSVLRWPDTRCTEMGMLLRVTRYTHICTETGYAARFRYICGRARARIASAATCEVTNFIRVVTCGMTFAIIDTSE